ncbi:hypothetical protein RFI_24983, partial [Reticulomyxa filosa]
IQIIIQHWIRILHIIFGWINDFDKLVVNYATTFFMFDTFCSSSKLINNYHQNVICSSSDDEIIRFWDFKHNNQLQIFNGHTYGVCGIEFSLFNGGHEGYVYCVKYGSNELLNTILSESIDKSVCLWDIRSGELIQVFYGHKDYIHAVEYSPFVIKNSIGNSNVICSGSYDNTICFWDIRSNKNELFMIEGNEGIICLKFLQLKKNEKDRKSNNDIDCDINLCYGLYSGLIRIWG